MKYVVEISIWKWGRRKTEVVLLDYMGAGRDLRKVVGEMSEKVSEVLMSEGGGLRRRKKVRRAA